MLEARLFGTPSLRLDGQEIVVPTKKALGLIAYLALEGQTSRANLARLFWGSMPEARARRNLRQELYRISNTPLDVALVQDAESVRPSETLKTDVTRFQQAVKLQRFAEALALHKDPLLENVRLPGASGFERWLERERVTLAETRRGALERHADTLAQSGALREALIAYQECLRDDELQEHHHREVMRLHALLGERGAALEQFDRLRRVLRREVGLEPLPETVALAEEIRAGGVLRAPITPDVVRVTLNPAGALPFVGRESDTVRLEGASRRGLVLISGEPGIGKSRLALEFARSHAPGVVLRGLEASVGTPLVPLAEAIRQALKAGERFDGLEPVWRREVARLVPELETEADLSASPPTPEGRSRFLEGLVRAIQMLVGSGGTLVLDDLHWFDASSLEVISYLIKRHNAVVDDASANSENTVLNGVSGRIQILATARDSELLERQDVTQFIESLERKSQLERIALERLTEPNLRQLAEAMTQEAVTESFTARLHQITSGNPLYTVETLRGLIESNDAITQEIPISETVRSAVLARVDRLGPAARRVLEAASLVGDGVTLELVAGASALSDWEALNVLEQATFAHLLEPAREGHRFSHDLVRQALEGGLTDARRGLLHRKLAETLEAQDGKPERIADHLERAGLSHRAIPFRVRAAEATSAVFAYREALDQYERAIQNGTNDRQTFEIRQIRTTLWEHLDDRDAWARELEGLNLLASHLRDPSFETQAILARADFAFTSSQFAEVLVLIEPMLEQPSLDVLQTVRARYRIGAALMNLGRASEARTHLEFALSLAPTTAFAWIGKLRHALAACAFDQDDLGGSRMHVEAALVAFRAAHDHPNEAASLSLKGHISQRLGEPSARQELEVALQLAREVGAVPVQLKALLNLAATTMAEGDYDAAMTYLETGLAVAREPQNPLLEAAYLMHLAALHWSRGDLGAVIDAASMALSVFDAVGSARFSSFNRVRLAGFLLECGDNAGARAVIAQTRKLLVGLSYPAVEAWCDATEARLEVATGHARVALERVERTLETHAGVPVQFRQQVLWALATAQLALGETRKSLETVAMIDGSPEHRARGLVIKLGAQSKLRHRTSDLGAAQEFLASRSVPPITRLHLHRALFVSFVGAGATEKAIQHHQEATALMTQLAETLEPGMREHFLRHWTALLGSIPSLEPTH